jgi:hypothetical protein
MLREIRNMIRPEPKREPLPEPRRYEPRAVDDTAGAVSEIRSRPAASASLRDTKGGTSADDPRERCGCFGAIAPSLDASRPSPCPSDRMVPPLRGASPSASLTASPGATQLRRVPRMPPSGRTRHGVTSCRRRWRKCRSRQNCATIRPRDYHSRLA